MRFSTAPLFGGAFFCGQRLNGRHEAFETISDRDTVLRFRPVDAAMRKIHPENLAKRLAYVGNAVGAAATVLCKPDQVWVARASRFISLEPWMIMVYLRLLVIG